MDWIDAKSEGLSAVEDLKMELEDDSSFEWQIPFTFKYFGVGRTALNITTKCAILFKF
jgi:hypothetical protein